MSENINYSNQDFFAYLRESKTKKNHEETKSVKFDLKNYLSTKLEKNEATKNLVVRFLPISSDCESNFIDVHTHMVKIDGKWKSFICLEKTEKIDHEKFGNKCPFCEANQAFWAEWRATDNEVKKKVFMQKANEYQATQTIICRVIERGKEEDGPKFWKFNVSRKGDGIMDKIEDLVSMRAEDGIDIFDIENGYDLQISIKKQKKTNGDEQTVISSITDKRKCKLSEDKELVEKWINDEKKWNEVFVAKSYEYCTIVLDGKTPWFDKEKNIWVPKESENEKIANAKSDSDTKQNKKPDEQDEAF